MPIDDRPAGDECDEGGEAPCWAHLLDDDGTLDPTTPHADQARCEGEARPTPSS